MLQVILDDPAAVADPHLPQCMIGIVYGKVSKRLLQTVLNLGQGGAYGDGQLLPKTLRSHGVSTLNCASSRL